LKETLRTAPSLEARMEAQSALAKLPRDSNRNRIVNRCALTGRPRGFLRRFGLSRIAFREKALSGELAGVIKSSW
jgi:small subunit ribosomal protein S14